MIVLGYSCVSGDIAQIQAAGSGSLGGKITPEPMSALVDSFDWASTSIGPASAWPQSLRTTVRILLTSRFPMWMAWGPELTFLYNDAYARTTLGKKHPWALGRPAHEVWSEIWDDIGPRIERVMATGQASWDETLLLIIERSGYREESYHTFSYSPLADSDERIVGMLCVVMEDTARVIGERQVASLSTLAAHLADCITESEVFAAIAQGLDKQRDLPFALVYLFDDRSDTLNLVSRVGIDAEHPAARAQIELDAGDESWPVQQLMATRRALTVDDLPRLFPALPTGLWDREPARARLVPIMKQGQETPLGIFIAGLNPYRQFDAGYAGFLDLVAGQIAASITSAQAFEGERRRAEALAELDQAKTAFFSNVSHELRTPLTLILGPIEDALAAETAPSRAAMEMLHRNGLRLLKLVNGLLDFVRIEAGRQHATFQPTDLSVLTAQLASVFRSAVERAGLRLVIDCPPLPEPVYVDREMWEKIVLNLLSNALKSTFEGEIRVSVMSDGGQAQVRIADTGTGISAGDLPKLFQRFQRLEGARRRSHEGSGIGLALVHELMEMHGGSIAVESRVDAGTTFTLSVPFGKHHLAPERVAESANPIALQDSAAAYVEEAMNWLPRPQRSGSGAQPPQVLESGSLDEAAAPKPVVLLVDDNSDMREYVAGLLSARFRVMTAENGRRALVTMAHQKPDLVLTDIMMPEMDGFALLNAVRQNPATRTIPVIMLSARAGEEARVEGIDAGADDYLIKPFTARELLTHVEAQIKMATLRRQAMEQEATLTRELTKARQFAWEALEHIPDAFATLDSEFRVTYLNAAAAATAAHLNPLGKCLWDLYPLLHGTVVEENFRRAMQERVALCFEHMFQRPDGTDNWFQFHIYPQPGEGLVLYLRNTTEGRKTEQALRRSEQLAAAGRMAASVAHEINNPLESLTNLLFLAKLDPSITGETRNMLEVADKELQRLSHIAARSLKFYRQRTAPAPVSLEELIETVLFFNEPDRKLRNVRLARRFRPAPAVLCHPGEIQQVVTNLIRNALDAVPQRGSLTVAVRPARDCAGREGVSVTVADTGSGMDRQTLGRLFHPFATTKGEAGTGLGLWVSKGILDKHKATIAVRSKPGRGTVFRLFFPLETGVDSAPHS